MNLEHTSISFHLIQLLKANTSCDEVKKSLLELGVAKKIELQKGLSIDVGNSGQNETNTNEYQDVMPFFGTLGFQNLSEGLNEFIKRFCNSKKCHALLFSLSDDTDFANIFGNSPFVVFHRLFCKSFAFGSLVNLTAFLCHYTSEEAFNDDYDNKTLVATEDLFAVFNHSEQEIHLYFRLLTIPNRKKRLNLKHWYRRYKLVISYDSIQRSVLNYKGDGCVSMFLPISFPPKIYSLKDDGGEDGKQQLFHKDPRDEDVTNEDIRENDRWVRLVDFKGICRETFGKSNCIKIDLVKHEKWNELDSDTQSLYPSPFFVVNSMLKMKTFSVHFGSVAFLRRTPPPRVKIPLCLSEEDAFRIEYALECLQSLSYQFGNDIDFNNRYTYKQEFAEFLGRDVNTFETCLLELFDAIASGSFVQVMPFLKRSFDRISNEIQVNPLFTRGIQKIRRAILTPTRTVVLPPLPFQESRFIRNCDPENALRLLLRDDNLQSLTFSLHSQSESEKNAFFRKCIKEPIMAGIRIHKKKYEFVGSSQSQLRDNGMFLYARDKEGRTADSIRRSFGQINERNVSKYVARVGLMLTQAQRYIDVSGARIKYDEPDIEIPGAVHPESKKPYNFSDGCGMISSSFAEFITQQLKEQEFLNEDDRTPSAFQIRLGGCKGMVAVNPQLKDYDIVLRDSMRKFESVDKDLGILKVSGLRSVYLNKPLITVLDQLGVDTSVFLKMQLDVLNDILHSFIDETKAAKIMKQYSLLHCHVKYDSLIDAGVSILSEPFFRQVLDIVIRHATFLLKTKGRIQIPLEHGRTMFGIVDETRTLKYGQVFVQASNIDDSKQPKVWKGKILVTKYPCMHPGDVRILRAVDVPALRHLVDCIVFPADGERPHSNEMAGSDMDGDEYAVIKYKQLFPKALHPPMIYPDNPAKKLDREITLEDIMDFYVNYIEEYSVGVIAKAHLCWADRLPRGIYDEKCMKLAMMYSISLDFAKTGLNCKLDAKDRPDICPDFMEKFSQKSTYLSRRALGALFRQISVFQLIFNEQFPLNVEDDDNGIFHHENSDAFRDSAITAYHEYSNLINNIQKMFKIANECEVMANIFNNENSFMSGKEELSDRQNMIHKLVRNGVKNLRKSFESEFENRLDDVSELKLAKASAFYYTTKELNSKAGRAYYGLPWIFSNYLSIVAKRNQELREHFENEESRLLYFANLIDERLIRMRRMERDNEPSLDCRMKRLDIAKSVLESWLDRQKYLKLDLYGGRQMAVSRVHNLLNEELIVSDSETVPSVGFTVISILKKFLNEDFMDTANASAEDTKQFKFTVGFSSLMTLFRLYKVRKVDHILPFRRNLVPTNDNFMLIKSFRLSFNTKPEKQTDLYRLICRNKRGFFDFLRLLSGVENLSGDWFMRQETFWYFQLIAFGQRAQLYALGFFVSKILFANGVNITELVENSVKKDFNHDDLNNH